MKSLVAHIGGSIALGIAAIGCAAAAGPAPAAFMVCAACHKVSADGANSTGPNLNGVVGRKAGSQSNFAYSSALKVSGIVWTVDKLDQWLSGPPKMVPGVRMVQTVPTAANRKAIIDYLAANR